MKKKGLIRRSRPAFQDLFYAKVAPADVRRAAIASGARPDLLSRFCSRSGNKNLTHQARRFVDRIQLVTVMKPNNPAVSAVVESVLRDAQIPFVIGGDQAFQNLYSIGPIEIQVHEQDAEAAKELLNSL